MPVPTSAPGTNAAGLPSNMYANLLADYQSASQANIGQQLAQGQRNKMDYEAELRRQREEMRKQGGFWNRLKGAFTGGIVSGVGQGVSGMLSTALNPFQMMGGARGQQVPNPLQSAAASGNPYASSMAEQQMSAAPQMGDQPQGNPLQLVSKLGMF